MAALVKLNIKINKSTGRVIKLEKKIKRLRDSVWDLDFEMKQCTSEEFFDKEFSFPKRLLCVQAEFEALKKIVGNHSKTILEQIEEIEDEIHVIDLTENI